MSETPLVEPCPPVKTDPSAVERYSLFFIEDGAVLFDARRRRIYALNAPAAFVWCLMDEGQMPALIAERLGRTFGFSTREATCHVAEVSRRRREMSEAFSIGAPPRLCPLAPPVDAHAPAETNNYRLLDFDFQLRLRVPGFADGLRRLLEPLTAGTPSDTSLPVDLIRERAGFAVIADGRVVERCEWMEQVVPMVKTALVQLALSSARDFCALHAAGVNLGGKCLILSGVSGAGKSTLTAALAAEGCAVMSDDTVVLADTLEARPMPFALCLKKGAWPLLTGRFPSLGNMEEHLRLDGKRVRYLSLPNRETWISPEHNAPVGWIVFLNRTEGAAGELVPLNRAEALARLLAECVPLGEGFDPAKVDQLVRWMGGIPCYELRYEALDAATGRLLELRR